MEERTDSLRVIHENWKRIKDDIHRKYHELSDHDLEATEGDMNRLEDLMTDRLGATRDEARRQLQNFLKPYQGAGKSQGYPYGRDDSSEGSEMIGEGIRGEIQDLTRDPIARGPSPGVQSGIQSGPQSAPANSLNASNPNETVHSNQNFSGQDDHKRASESRFERPGQVGGAPTGTEFGSESGDIGEIGDEPGGIQFGSRSPQFGADRPGRPDVTPARDSTREDQFGGGEKSGRKSPPDDELGERERANPSNKPTQTDY